MTFANEMKSFADFLASLTDAERDHIANLDYKREVSEHRRQLDIVIATGGHVDFATQWWTPYEVLDLGKHCLDRGHEREFVACNGIILLNISTGNDISNDVTWVYPNFLTFRSKLEDEYVSMIEPLGQLAMKKSEQVGDGDAEEAV